MNTIKETVELVNKWHGGQLYGKTLHYIVHLMLVARHFDDPKLKAIALLHDVVEDTHITFVELSSMYGEEIAGVVAVLTRGNDKYLEEYIPRIANNPVARKIKIADLKENIYFSEHYNIILYMDTRLERYKKALEILEGAENEQ
jgi:(p)ppGpp synthase/HD superfamily hydrolase